MDLVYVYKRQGDGRELRYSLRSACQNLDFDRVHIVGDCPSFVRRVNRIPYTPQPAENRYDNSFGKTLRAARSKDVSEDFILMNDDFFILKPFQTIPYLFMQQIGRWVEAYPHRGEYYEKARRTLALTRPRAKVFEVHFPFVYNSSRLLALVERYNLPCGIMPRTLYAHEYSIQGVRSRDYKARTVAEIAEFSTKPFMSTTNNVALTREFAATLERQFPEPCRFERAA